MAGIVLRLDVYISRDVSRQRERRWWMRMTVDERKRREARHATYVERWFWGGDGRGRVLALTGGHVGDRAWGGTSECVLDEKLGFHAESEMVPGQAWPRCGER
jgi:hypothetical protein